ncbi:trypsin-like serine peptidase [Actinosynnema sp. NPDC004786]
MRARTTTARRILAGSLLAAALAAAPTTAHAAPAVPDAATPQSAPAGLSPEAAALSADPGTALARFWTPERIAAAKPADQGVSLAELRSTAQSSVLGELAVGGRAPVAAEDGKVGALAGATGTSWPYRHDWVSLTNGKVLYEDNGLWHCSGVVVTTEARNTVFTAGHCVHGGKGGTWLDRNWTFIPDYYYGDRPLGTWAARQLWTLNGWINDNDRAYDIGAAVMHPLNGAKLMDVTGSQGIRFNGPTTPSVWHFGFPLNSPFDGEDLITCDGPTSLRYGIFGDLKLACTMQGGASGGAWLADFNQDWGYTVSVNSYHVGDDLTQIYGPYFGDGAKNLYESVRNLA